MLLFLFKVIFNRVFTGSTPKIWDNGFVVVVIVRVFIGFFKRMNTVLIALLDCPSAHESS